MSALTSLGVEKAEEKTEAIVASRLTRPLHRDALEFILGEDYHSTPVSFYLGHQTWFWQLEVRRGGRKLTWVLARIPPSLETDKMLYRIIEERQEP